MFVKWDVQMKYVIVQLNNTQDGIINALAKWCTKMCIPIESSQMFNHSYTV